jgi:hypothetical protein
MKTILVINYSQPILALFKSFLLLLPLIHYLLHHRAILNLYRLFVKNLSLL